MREFTALQRGEVLKPAPLVETMPWVVEPSPVCPVLRPLLRALLLILMPEHGTELSPLQITMGCQRRRQAGEIALLAAFLSVHRNLSMHKEGYH